ncbi:uncharacterized protein LOC116298612 [Actinia tenebrosa]|uniref:Uncharacterized protein LOC116298612 n=1 Tax=Actinia tenebrosa TaxID=6105 RepID=A0A6P8I368_ACTTE|nr:uncharacterized protein LOC116298612 [Actinia tenebrosa]
MGCGTSQVKKTERSNSQVTIESQQRTVAAYRRQRIARDMEQVASLRAEAEVEKALMLKRSSLGSVDDRRPSYVMRVLEDLAEVEEGQEEVEERCADPVIPNGTYHNEKLAELEHNMNKRNTALHSSVTQRHSATPENELEDDLLLNTRAQNNELVEDKQNENDTDIVLHTSVTQENSVTPKEELPGNLELTTRAQNDNENALDSAEAKDGLSKTIETKEESYLDVTTCTQNDEQNSNPISDLETIREEEREGFGSKDQRGSIFHSTTHAHENTAKTNHNLTHHEKEEGDTRKEDDMENKLVLTAENDNPRE